MKGKKQQLFNTEKIKTLLDAYFKITGISNAVIDISGRFIARSPRHEACRVFHRANPESCKLCKQSDLQAIEKAQKQKGFEIYTCMFGINEAISPIRINHKTVLFFLVGQFFTTPITPSQKQHFEKIAKEYNFPKEKYLKAIENLPVVPEEKIQDILFFSEEFARQIADISLSNNKLFQIQQELKQSKDKLETVNMNISLEIERRTQALQNANEILYKEVNRRKYTEAALKKNKAALSAILESSSDSIWSVDKDLKLITLNSKFKEDFYTFFGIHIKPGVKISEYIPQGEKQKWEQYYQRALKDNAFSAEEHYQFEQGERHLHISFFPIREEHEISGVAVYARDISEQKKSENALRKSEEKFRSLVENINDILFSVNLKGEFTYVSPVIEQISHFSQSEILGTHFANFVHPDDLHLLEKGFKDTLAGVLYPSEFRVIDKDNSIRYFRTSSQPVYENEQLVGMTGIITDITNRRESENMLRRFRLALDNSGDSIFLIDYQSLKIIDANQTASQSLGYTTDELLKMSPAEIKPYMSEAQLQQIFQEVIESPGKRKVIQTTHKRKDETEFPVEISLSSSHYDKGKIIIASVRNVSERVQQEQVLKQLVENTSKKTGSSLFRAIARQLAEVLDMSFAGIAQATDPSIKRLRILEQYSQGSYWEEFEYDVEGTPCKTVLGKKMQIYPENVQTLFPDDPFFPENGIEGYWGVPLFDTGGNAIGLMYALSTKRIEPTPWKEYIFRIFSVKVGAELERIQAEQALRMSRAKYELLMNNSSDLICELTLEGKYTFLNTQYKRILKIQNQKNLLGTSAFARIHPDDVPATQDVFMRGVENKHPVETVYRYLNGDNEWIWLESRGNFYTGQDGIDYAVIISRDVTASKKIEEQLKRAKEHADEANRAKSEFLANMSHEIRTPLNAILGFSEILKDKLTEYPEYSEYLAGIKHSGNNLLNIINDILDLSKIESGRIEMNVRSVNPYNIISEIRQIFYLKTKDKKLDFQVKVSPELPKALLLDETRLRQILFNLIGNAVKFTNQGSVLVEVNSVGKDQEGSKVDIAFRISDTGIGIKKEQQEAIFEPFRQQEGQNSRKYGGTGLGLAITKRLVEIMDGEIALESTWGKGSTFSVVLRSVKVAVLEEQDKNARQQSIVPVFESPLILLVEDIESNRQVVRGYLESFNTRIIEAVNGQQGVEKTKEHAPDLILMDMQMPVMDGYQATLEIKKYFEKSNKTCPVVALTASAMHTQIAEIKALCDDYLRKPVSRQDLIRKLMKFLPYQKQARKTPKTPDYVGSLAHYKAKQGGFPAQVLESFENNLLPVFKIVWKKQVFAKIKNFARLIIALGEANSIPALAEYGKELENDVITFKTENISKLLMRFKEIYSTVTGKELVL